MADTNIKLSGTYDSIEAYNILEEMRQITPSINNSIASLSSGKLNLSGGTMSGHLQFSTESTEIRKTTNAGYLILRGGTSYNNSANVLIYGNDNTNNAGQVILRGGSGTVGLVINKDGTTSVNAPATTDNSSKIATTAWCKTITTGSGSFTGGNCNGTYQYAKCGRFVEAAISVTVTSNINVGANIDLGSLTSKIPAVKSAMGAGISYYGSGCQIWNVSGNVVRVLGATLTSGSTPGIFASYLTTDE